MSRIGHANANKGSKLLQFTDRHLPLTMLLGAFRYSCIQANMMPQISSLLNTTHQVRMNPSDSDRHNNGITLKRTFPYPLISPISRRVLIMRNIAKKTMLA